MDRMRTRSSSSPAAREVSGGAACAAPASEGAADVVADILEDAGQQTVAEIERSGGRARFARPAFTVIELSIAATRQR